MARRYFGNIRELPSGRYQASYKGPDGARHTAPQTFDSRQYADAWLSRVRTDIQRGDWEPLTSKSIEAKTESDRTLVFGEYAAGWLAGRDLSGSTRQLYRMTLGNQILPAFEDTALSAITPAMVRGWHAKLRTETGPTQRARAYSLLRTILNTAVTDDVIVTNPCRIRGAGTVKAARDVRPASLPELEALAAAMPRRYRLMVLLAAWCALRFGELAELRRSDVDAKNGVVRVRRGVIRSDDGILVKGPKSEAGKRDVNIPPHLMPAVQEHLLRHTRPGQDALLFPSAHDPAGHLNPATLRHPFRRAREAAGRPDLHFHDLRHTGAVLAAATGATLAELMARLGHSTVSAAMRYQHAAADRDKVIAAALSELAAGTVTPITSAKGKRARTAR
jgi:integrase